MDRGAWFILRGQIPAQPLPARFSLSKAPGVPGLAGGAVAERSKN